jgi:hypothetical protein
LNFFCFFLDDTGITRKKLPSRSPQAHALFWFFVFSGSKNISTFSKQLYKIDQSPYRIGQDTSFICQHRQKIQVAGLLHKKRGKLQTVRDKIPVN